MRNPIPQKVQRIPNIDPVGGMVQSSGLDRGFDPGEEILDALGGLVGFWYLGRVWGLGG